MKQKQKPPKEVFWHDLAKEFPDMTMAEAFRSEVQKSIAAGLMQHPPRPNMTEQEWKEYRAAFRRKAKNGH